mgnify:CR=1 FL=1
MSLTELYAYHSYALFVAILAYILRQPLMHMAHPASNELMMNFVGKKNQELIYDNPIIRLFNIPVFYMPKFWHPDPSVKRQSGFLKPVINNSNIFCSNLFSIMLF